MGLNSTPSANRVHIGFFGRRNAGKSSVVNAVTGQELAVVSDTKGTTTDPVYKAMELLPIGPVMIIDTPGFDDEGALGELRVRKTKQVLNKTDIAVLVVDATEGKKQCDEELLEPGVIRTEALGMIETFGIVFCIEAADAMCKAADVEMIGFENTASGYISVLVEGDVGACKTAVAAGIKAVEAIGHEVYSSTVIARPHEGLKKITCQYSLDKLLPYPAE